VVAVSAVEAGLRVADQFWFIAHDDRAGQSRVHPRVIELGLAAAVLGELVIRDRLRIDGGNVYVSVRESLNEPVGDFVVAQLMAYRQHHDADTWLAYFAQTVSDKVIERLLDAGRVYPVRHRGLGGRRTSYAPVDANHAAWQAVRLEQMLNGRVRMTEPDAFLAGLILATGLTRHVLWDPTTSAAGSVYLPEVVESLFPSSLYALTKHLDVAVGQTVLVPR
jgi:hypothetical protein